MKSFFAAVIALTLTTAFSAETYQQAMKAGHQNRARRKFKEAAASYLKAEKLAANNSAKYYARYFLGTVAAHEKKYDKSAEWYRKSLEVASTDKLKAQSLYQLGYYLMVAKKNQEALNELKKIEVLIKGKDQISLDRTNCVIARVYINLKKYNEAYAAAILASGSKDKNLSVQALSNSFDAAAMLKDKAKAKEAIGKMAVLAESLPEGYLRFRVYQQTYSYYCNIERNLEKALNAADQIASNPKFGKQRVAYGIYYKALVYNLMKKKDLAKEQWQKLENCGVKYFENLAKRNLKSLIKK